MAGVVVTDCLIVGAGPAGAALACFLARDGLKPMMISKASGTADTPRSHVVNPFGLECLRDIGLEDQCIRMGLSGTVIESMRWCKSLIGDEYSRVHTWGGAPSTRRDVQESTPCRFLDLPQSYMEPLLLRYATTNGTTCKFDTELISFARDANGVLSTVKDLTCGITYQIRSRFIFGADGGKSIVGRVGGFSFNVAPAGAIACNILVTADVDGSLPFHEGTLNIICNPEAASKLAVAPVLRLIRPMHEWLVIAVSLGLDNDPFASFTPDSHELINYIKGLFGDDTIDVKIQRLDRWKIRETVAEKYSDEHLDMFLLGDAAHRHPPTFGLGSNTCIQDAFNLAWKISYVLRGLAGRGLLETYTRERQPVGAQLVRLSNDEMHRHAAMWQALGLLAPTPEEGKEQVAELAESTEAGARRRKDLFEASEGKRREGESFGLAMNQWYDRVNSTAIFLDDEEERPLFGEAGTQDEICTVLVSTYPGTRLPHAWLTSMTPTKPISTIDLAGHGAFCLLTGHGGKPWMEACAQVTKRTGIPIRSAQIGWGLDFHDKLRDWSKKSEIDEDGCVLVRPDRYVCWRSKRIIPNPEQKLLAVLDRILSRNELELPN